LGPPKLEYWQFGLSGLWLSNTDRTYSTFRDDIYVKPEQLDQFVCNGQTSDMMIYKIFRDAEWARMQADGTTPGAPIDVADGYVHFSGADTIAKTAALYFADIPDLWLVAVQADGLDGLRWETSRGGAAFPHLYRAFDMADVAWAKPLPVINGYHQFPELT